MEEYQGSQAVTNADSGATMSDPITDFTSTENAGYWRARAMSAEAKQRAYEDSELRRWGQAKPYIAELERRLGLESKVDSL